MACALQLLLKEASDCITTCKRSSCLHRAGFHQMPTHFWASQVLYSFSCLSFHNLLIYSLTALVYPQAFYKIVWLQEDVRNQNRSTWTPAVELSPFPQWIAMLVDVLVTSRDSSLSMYFGTHFTSSSGQNYNGCEVPNLLFIVHGQKEG